MDRVAMKRRIKTVLKQYLKDLEKKSFISFKHELNECSVPTGYNNIPWGELEEADAEKVTELIIRYYTTEHGPQVVKKVLEDINERQASLELHIWLEEGKTQTTTHRCLKRGRNEKRRQTDPALMCFEGPLPVDDVMVPAKSRRTITDHPPNMESKNNKPEATNTLTLSPTEINSSQSGTGKNYTEQWTQTELYEPDLYQTPETIPVTEMWQEPRNRRMKTLSIGRLIQFAPTISIPCCILS
ncbi:uncharacterized protein O3C94_018749 [Discoglossus pictus]